MTKTQGWQKFAWQWLLACVALKLLQIWFDGVAGLFANMIGVNTMGGLFGVLTIFRAISGGLGGALQGWALPQKLVNRRLWIVATGIGMAIAFLVMQWLWMVTKVPAPSGIMGLMLPPESRLPMFVLEGIMGIVLGIFQWFVLRKNVPKAGLWIAVSGLGLAVTSVAIALLQRLLGSSGLYVSPDATNPIFLVIALVGIIFYAALTGSFLFWSLRQPNKAFN
jgi:hypothetical protein